MKKCAIIIILVLFCFSGFTPKKQEVLDEKEMSQLVGKAGVYLYCWSYGCQPEFPGIDNCLQWTGPGLDTEKLCDYCTGQPENSGKFCKPTNVVHIMCRVWGADNICGQKQKGICRYRYDEETEQYLSHCDFGGETTPDYGMCIWGWQFCEQWPVP